MSTSGGSRQQEAPAKATFRVVASVRHDSIISNCSIGQCFHAEAEAHRVLFHFSSERNGMKNNLRTDLTPDDGSKLPHCADKGGAAAGHDGKEMACDHPHGQRTATPSQSDDGNDRPNTHGDHSHCGQGRNAQSKAHSHHCGSHHEKHSHDSRSGEHHHHDNHGGGHSHADHGHTHGGIFGAKSEMIFALVCGSLLAIGFITDKLAAAPGWLPLGCYIAAYFFGGFYTVREAIDNLRLKRFEIDTLMLVAAAGAAALGSWAEGALLLFLFSLGHALEHYALGRAKRAIEALAKLAPETATVRRDGHVEEVAVSKLLIGDTVLVRPNERLPADGFVVQGTSSINQAPITGESMPVDKRPVANLAAARSRPEAVDAASRTFAGTINGSGAIEIEVTHLASDSAIARVVKMVSEAQTRRAPTQRFTDKFERIFVPMVLGLAFLILFSWVVVDEPFRDSFYRSMAVLVAASPCALAIATPSAVLSGIARAARGGVLLKGGAPLEELGSLTAIAFDKTGTLTEGRPRITDVIPTGNATAEELLGVALAVESLSDHPLAVAIVRDAGAALATGQSGGGTANQKATAPEADTAAAKQDTATQPNTTAALKAHAGNSSAESTSTAFTHQPATGTQPGSHPGIAVNSHSGSHSGSPVASDLQSLTGLGVRATVGNETVWIGKAEMFGKDAVPALSNATLHAVEQLRANGRTIMVVKRGGEDLGVIGLLDTPRPEARATLQQLRALGIRRMILISGDHQKAADAVAKEIGLDEAWGDLMPEDKVVAIRKIRQQRKVAMVGDGVNDAPAMANASVGIAMGAAGSDVALETADIALMADNLRTLPFAVGLSRHTRRIILQNVFVSLGVIAVLVPMTIAGLNIGAAVAIHEGSTLVVVFNALRLLAYRDKTKVAH